MSNTIHHAILNGDDKTGVTTFQIQQKVDAGAAPRQCIALGEANGRNVISSEICNPDLSIGALKGIKILSVGWATVQDSMNIYIRLYLGPHLWA